MSLLVKLAGGHLLSVGISALDTEGIEPYSLLMRHRERDSLTQGHFDSTLGMFALFQAGQQSSKSSKTFKILPKLSNHPGYKNYSKAKSLYDPLYLYKLSGQIFETRHILQAN